MFQGAQRMMVTSPGLKVKKTIMSERKERLMKVRMLVTKEVGKTLPMISVRLLKSTKLLGSRLRALSRAQIKTLQIVAFSQRSRNQVKQIRLDLYLARLVPLPLSCHLQRYKLALDRQAPFGQRCQVE
jgi:hypothetical protein